MASQKYTPDFKYHAVMLAKKMGAKKAARKLREQNEEMDKLTDRHIRAWARELKIDIVHSEDLAAKERLTYKRKVKNAETREAMREKLLVRVHDILDAMDQPHQQWLKGEGGILELKTLTRPPSNAIRDYAVAAGVLIDKFRLEAGEATSRSETVSGKQRDAIDEELEKLAQQLANKAAEEADLTEAKKKAGELVDEATVNDSALREPSKDDL
jgi:hypothetical protein